MGEPRERKGVVEAAHGSLVGDGLEAVARRAADALSGRIGSDEFWIFFFELLEFVEQLVEGGVGNLGVVNDMIQIFVMTNFFAQALDFIDDCAGRFWVLLVG